jgi:hypothetical protein
MSTNGPFEMGTYIVYYDHAFAVSWPDLGPNENAHSVELHLTPLRILLPSQSDVA